MSNRLQSSAALIHNPLDPSEPGYGEIFISAAIGTNKYRQVTIVIDEKTPTVALNDRVRNKFRLKYTVPEIQAGYGTNPYSLISCGMFLWVQQPCQSLRSILIQKNDPLLPQGHWTEPAKRCGEDPPKTFGIAARTELLILKRGFRNSHFRPVIVNGADYITSSPLALKRMQIAMRAAEIEATGLPLAEIITNKAWHINPQPMRHEAGLHKPVLLSISAMPPTSSINGMLEVPFSAMPFFNAELNTLELRRSATIRIDKHDEILFFDGEKNARNTAAYTLEEMIELQKKKAVRPALKFYLDACQQPRLRRFRSLPKIN